MQARPKIHANCEQALDGCSTKDFTPTPHCCLKLLNNMKRLDGDNDGESGPQEPV